MGNSDHGMDPIINVRLTNLIQRGQALLDGLLRELGMVNAPAASVTRQAVAEGAGLLAAELFGSTKARGYGKRLTASWLDLEKKKVQQQISDMYAGAYVSWMADVEAVLRQVSIPGPRLKTPGNSATMIRRVRQADSRQKVDTRFTFALSQLQSLRGQELVWNANLPKALPRSPKQPNPAMLLQELETLLRRCIEHQLSAVAPDWWSQRVTVNSRKRAEKRKQDRETVWPWYPPTSTSPVDYLDFSDYRKLILDPANWNDCFSKVFKTQGFIETRLQELEPIRNEIAHSRDVGATARQKLKIYADEIKECVSRWMP